MSRSIVSRVKLGLGYAAIAAFATAGSTVAHAQLPVKLSVDVGKPGIAIPPNFSGLMTEEINHAYDGGLFAELIQNRTFQDPAPRGGGGAGPIHWAAVGGGKISTDTTDPVNSALPVSLKLTLSGGEAGVANDGYWGIPVRPDTTYTVTFYAKGKGFSGPIVASLRTDAGDVTVAKSETKPITDGWQKYSLVLKTGNEAPTTAKARFVLSATGTGTVWFSYVSLFPPTYQNSPNGLRPDLMKLMAGLKPKFIRLPGGNYAEGSRFADRFNWKQMIGPADQRPGHMGCWGYRSSDGFGMPEYLLWCKQLDAEPVLAVFAGYTLNGDHFKAGTPEMGIYTQEALDEIEYVSGPASSKWGKKRAEDGFPKPFPLHYVEIGNEDWFDRSGSYDGRFTEMAKAIRARYPNIKIIATAPVKGFKPDLYDDHYYRGARQLMEMTTLYDKPVGEIPQPSFAGGGSSGRQPNGILTFVGEWATQEGQPTPTLNAGLADAAFVMGLERNSDAVPMECYAPLLVNVNPADPAKGYPKGWQWNTNLIGYDALRSFGSPSYYAQAMLADNQGDVVLPTNLVVTPVAAVAPVVATAAKLQGKVGVGSWHTQVEYTEISVTTPDGRKLLTPEMVNDPKGWAFTSNEWSVGNQTVKTSASDSETWAITGDPKWTDYTIHLRARKVGGEEGFLVIWHAANDSTYRWWNIGGWGNTKTQCETADGGSRTPYGRSAGFTVETGRWYDLRLEVTGSRIRGYVDSKLVTEATYQPAGGAAAPSSSVVATATYEKASHTVIVKVVNAGATAIDGAINLSGVKSVEPKGTAIVLAGEPGAVNTLDEPMKVAPKTETVTDAAPTFHRTFPPHSLTILRLKAQ